LWLTISRGPFSGSFARVDGVVKVVEAVTAMEAAAVLEVLGVIMVCR
jgi:hypothetical protein